MDCIFFERAMNLGSIPEFTKDKEQFELHKGWLLYHQWSALGIAVDSIQSFVIFCIFHGLSFLTNRNLISFNKIIIIMNLIISRSKWGGRNGTPYIRPYITEYWFNLSSCLQDLTSCGRLLGGTLYSYVRYRRDWIILGGKLHFSYFLWGSLPWLQTAR